MNARKTLVAALAVAGIATDALAVRLNPDGLGQALIYPYYTVQSSEGSNSWNTYLSVTNHSADVKALRVRFREGRNGRNVGNLNLYLSPNDAWTGAIVPSDQDPKSVARIITIDNSCTYPQLPGGGETFTNVGYTGSLADGLGDGLDRTREGYIEIIEMASLTGAAAAAVTHAYGVPRDCRVVQNPNFDGAPDLRPPTGGISGTLTLINVNSGMDAGMNAIALEGLANKPFFRGPDSDYPGFSAAEILPVSTVRAGGKEYDLNWKNGVDAVSSVFMASEVLNEFVLDPQTASQTDWVITFPTWAYFSPPRPPFTADPLTLKRVYYDREGNARNEDAYMMCGWLGFPCAPPVRGWVAGAVPINHHDSFSLLGGLWSLRFGEIDSQFIAGWMRISVGEGAGDYGRLRSEAGSLMTDLATGAVTSGRFELFGLPWTGFMVRTFKNGTLRCGYQGATSCQGNYAGSFPHRYVRTITQIP